MQQTGVRMGVGVGGIQAVDVRQKDQKLRLHALCHNGRQGVVVADDDLIGGYGVVFVDDGQSAQLQKTAEGIGEVLLALVVGDVVSGDQQLGYGMVVLAEQLVIDVHQLALAYGGGCLLGGNVSGPLPESQLADAHADGAGGDQDQLMPRVFDITHDPAEGLHPPDVQMPGGMGQSGGPDFDNNAHGYASRCVRICSIILFWPWEVKSKMAFSAKRCRKRSAAPVFCRSGGDIRSEYRTEAWPPACTAAWSVWRRRCPSPDSAGQHTAGQRC